MKGASMIYTVTLNPSLDYIVNINQMREGTVNRTEKEIIFPGGKGINVSIVLQNLGVQSTALGFIAGFTGGEIKKKVIEMGLSEKFIHIANGFSRINVKIRSEKETEINGMGPDVSTECLASLFNQLDDLEKGDVLVLSGSIPISVPVTIYQDIMSRYKDRGVLITVDATKDLLTNVLPLKPFLIKPNIHELGELFQISLTNTEEVIMHAVKLQEKGARNVLVSMAGDGAVLVTEEGSVYQAQAPVGKVVNSVGAGDSMVAGFLYGYLSFGDYEKAFYYGLCAGSASAFSENLATSEEIEILIRKLRKDWKHNGSI